jgi:hypothetical protein
VSWLIQYRAGAELIFRGFRPELARDLSKLRETVWEEVS